MPYSSAHHNRRDKIVDLEVKRLELRKTARPARATGGTLATVVRFPRSDGSASLRSVA